VNHRDDPGRLLVDPAVLVTLRAELDDDEGWLLFLECFLAQLPLRIQKLGTGLLTADHGLAMDAVLSLKISSQMVGADRLAGMALHLQGFLEDMGQQGNAVLPQLASRHLGPITACAEETAVQLAGAVGQASPNSPGAVST
jgi:histidine phosphotransfer protein HptB